MAHKFNGSRLPQCQETDCPCLWLLQVSTEYYQATLSPERPVNCIHRPGERGSPRAGSRIKSHSNQGQTTALGLLVPHSHQCSLLFSTTPFPADTFHSSVIWTLDLRYTKESGASILSLFIPPTLCLVSTSSMFFLLFPFQETLAKHALSLDISCAGNSLYLHGTCSPVVDIGSHYSVSQ